MSTTPERALAVEAKVRHSRPCGGCGETDPKHRCIGCLHDFGAPIVGELMPRESDLHRDARELLERTRDIASRLGA